MEIIGLIPEGRENAIPRNMLLAKCLHYGIIDINIKNPDRKMRKMIEKARNDYAILNNQDNKGYYRPTRSDYAELRKYITQEENRAKSIFFTLNTAKALCEDIKHERLDE